MSAQSVIGVGLIAYSVWLLWSQRTKLIYGWRSRHWQPVRATVFRSRSHPKLFPHTWAALVSGPYCSYTFSYHVSGQTFTSTRYSYAVPDIAPSNLCEGEHVTIYLDPQEPTRAVVR